MNSTGHLNSLKKTTSKDIQESFKNCQEKA
jgi:phage tail tape-measure protein